MSADRLVDDVLNAAKAWAGAYVDGRLGQPGFAAERNLKAAVDALIEGEKPYRVAPLGPEEKGINRWRVEHHYRNEMEVMAWCPGETSARSIADALNRAVAA